VGILEILVIFGLFQIADLDDLLSQVSRKTPELRYISLLGNPACPDQLTNRDCDYDDYQRYRFDILSLARRSYEHDSPNVAKMMQNECQDDAKDNVIMTIAFMEIDFFVCQMGHQIINKCKYNDKRKPHYEILHRSV